MKTRLPPILSALVAFGLGLWPAVPVAAAEKSPVTPGLPGVEGEYRIVKPAPPEAEPDETPLASGRYGRWDVTVSGKLTIDVGAGDLPTPRGSGN